MTLPRPNLSRLALIRRIRRFATCSSQDRLWCARSVPLLSWIVVFCVMISSVCNATLAANPDYVVTGKIWTANKEMPLAEAIAIEGERIVAVGSLTEVKPLIASDTKVLNISSGLVLPGFIDSHIHFVTGGANLKSVQLRDAATPEEFTKRIADFAKQLPAGRWITGGDWDHTLWGGQLPDRQWIDSKTPVNPVWIQRLDGHMGLANTAAMRAAGLKDSDSRDVSGGEIVRDSKGRPTGIFKDNAMSLIGHAVPPPTIEDRLESIQIACDYVLARGVTCVHHMGDWDEVEALRLAAARNLLNVRVYACTPLSQWQRLAEEIGQRGRGNPLLSLGGLKGFVDGSLGSHTAAFLEPYSDTPQQRGLLVNRREDLHQWIAGADQAGLQVAVHAIGDRAIRLILDVFEQVAVEQGDRDRRFRVEHAQHIHPADIPRFAQLGVIASMQPYHAIDDGRWAEPIIGLKRCETTYAFRSLLDSKAHLAFGSDWFVAPPTPLLGLDASVTRRTLDGKNPSGWIPRQKITVDEALKAYTIDAAFAGFMEIEVGSLEVGKLADLVILDADLLEVPSTVLPKANVRFTMVGGKLVYEAD